MARPAWSGGGGGVFPNFSGTQKLSVVNRPWGNNGDDNLVTLNFDMANCPNVSTDSTGHEYAMYMVDFASIFGTRVPKPFLSMYVWFDFNPDQNTTDNNHTPLVISFSDFGQIVSIGATSTDDYTDVEGAKGATTTLCVPLLCSTNTKILISKQNNPSGPIVGAGSIIFSTKKIQTFQHSIRF